MYVGLSLVSSATVVRFNSKPPALGPSVGHRKSITNPTRSIVDPTRSIVFDNMYFECCKFTAKVAGTFAASNFCCKSNYYFLQCTFIHVTVTSLITHVYVRIYVHMSLLNTSPLRNRRTPTDFPELTFPSQRTTRTGSGGGSIRRSRHNNDPEGFRYFRLHQSG